MKFLDRKRLLQNGIDRQWLGRFIGEIVGGTGDQNNVLTGQLFSQDAGEFDAVGAGHGVVGDDQVVRRAGKEVERFLDGAANVRLVAEA